MLWLNNGDETRHFGGNVSKYIRKTEKKIKKDMVDKYLEQKTIYLCNCGKGKRIKGNYGLCAVNVIDHDCVHCGCVARSQRVKADWKPEHGIIQYFSRRGCIGIIDMLVIALISFFIMISYSGFCKREAHSSIEVYDLMFSWKDKK